ncbi:MAG: DinB family protein [Gemmatimonadetes bacterium]|nr:DinB family protein [Gemmatimonadota bacterium]
MHADDLRRLYDYHYWANRAQLAVVAQLTSDQFTRDVSGSYGSVRNTLVHMLSAEAGWLERCGGPARGPKFEPHQFPTVSALVERWTTSEAQVRAFLAPLTDADTARVIEFSLGGPTQRGALGDLMAQGALHGIHHRGQVALLLRALGVVPGNTDYVLFAVA